MSQTEALIPYQCKFCEADLRGRGMAIAFEGWPFCNNRCVEAFNRKHNKLGVRDRFALGALQGLLASDTRPKDANPEDELVDLAYRYADAMMRRRER